MLLRVLRFSCPIAINTCTLSASWMLNPSLDLTKLWRAKHVFIKIMAKSKFTLTAFLKVLHLFESMPNVLYIRAGPRQSVVENHFVMWQNIPAVRPCYVLGKGKRLIANNSVGHIWTYSSWERLAFWNIRFIIFKLHIKISSFEDGAVKSPFQKRQRQCKWTYNSRQQ